MVTCAQCGEELVPGDKYCTHCGAAVEKPVAVPAAARREPSGDSVSAEFRPTAEATSDVPGQKKGTRSAVLKVLAVAVVAVLVLGGIIWLVWPEESSTPPIADPSAPTEAAITIGEVTVTGPEQPDTTFEFTADAVVPNPQKALRCQISYSSTVFTAAGTMIEETEESVDFTLAVATRAMDLMESLFPDSGVQVICSVDGASVSQTIDRNTGALITPPSTETSPSPTSSTDKLPPMDPPDAPAVQINLSEFRVSPVKSTLDFVTTVEGGTSGANLQCVVSNIEPRDLITESRTLSGGVEELRFTEDLTDVYAYLKESAWFLINCKGDGGSAYETVASPAG